MKRITWQYLAAVAAAVALAAWLSPAFRAVVWDATWGNNMAAVEWAAAGGVTGFLARDHIGRKAAAWWDRHNGPHAVRRHRQALREHEDAKKQEGPP